jgi:hypothetical protein
MNMENKINCLGNDATIYNNESETYHAISMHDVTNFKIDRPKKREMDGKTYFVRHVYLRTANQTFDLTMFSNEKESLKSKKGI